MLGSAVCKPSVESELWFAGSDVTRAVVGGLADHTLGLLSPAHLLDQDQGWGGLGSETRLTHCLFPFCSQRPAGFCPLTSALPDGSVRISGTVGGDWCHRHDFFLYLRTPSEVKVVILVLL